MKLPVALHFITWLIWWHIRICCVHICDHGFLCLKRTAPLPQKTPKTSEIISFGPSFHRWNYKSQRKGIAYSYLSNLKIWDFNALANIPLILFLFSSTVPQDVHIISTYTFISLREHANMSLVICKHIVYPSNKKKNHSLDQCRIFKEQPQTSNLFLNLSRNLT